MLEYEITAEHVDPHGSIGRCKQAELVIGTDMTRVNGVVSVHDLHVWSLTSRRIALSAHVVVAHMDNWERVLEELRNMLRHNYAIEHVALQPEPPPRQVVHGPGSPPP